MLTFLNDFIDSIREDFDENDYEVERLSPGKVFNSIYAAIDDDGSGRV